MTAHEAELHEIRTRLERLECAVAALREDAEKPGSAPLVGQPVLADTVQPTLVAAAAPAEPPLLQASIERRSSPPQRGLAARFESVSSTVWIAAAGAVIFLIGAIYGLTVSIERGWISPAVRVVIGLLTGVAAGVVAMRLLLAERRQLGVTLLAVGVGTWTFALYFGAKAAHLFSSGLGFAGAAVATLLAGAIAARIRSDGAMAVALAVGLAAPIAFSDHTGSLPGLLAYFVVLIVAQLAAHYASGTGADWKVSRLLGGLGVWLLTVAASLPGTQLGEPRFAVATVLLLAATTLVLAWLPRHPEKPWAPAANSVVVLIAAALALWSVWRRAQWEPEFYAIVPVAFAGVSLGLLGAARRLTVSTRHDQPFALLAAGFGLIAVPIAIEWRWVTVAWGVGALLLALAARKKEGRDENLTLIAGIVAVAASTVWLALAFSQGATDLMFLNPVFIGGVFTAGAWAVLLRLEGALRGVAFSGLQFVAVNGLAWEFSRKIGSVSGDEATLPIGALLATLTYAAAGAAQWLRGVLYEVDERRAKALRLAGYGWLAVAAVKLLGYDLDNHDLLFRAVAALGVGAVFIGAALWADRHRARNEPPASP